jgi:hypothetical protein
LGSLGDQEWLQQQIGATAVPVDRIAQGIAYPYRAWNSKPGTTALHLDYAPLERALDLKHPALTRALNEELSPGTGYCSLRVEDLEQALSLCSPFTLWCACMLLASWESEALVPPRAGASLLYWHKP